MRTCVLTCVALLLTALPAWANEPPGAPENVEVTVDGQHVSVGWNRPGTGGPVSGYQIIATRDGASFPGSPFNIPVTTTRVSAGPLPPGEYTLEVLAWNGFGFRTAAVVHFVISLFTGQLPGVPFFPRSIVTGGDVVVEWDAPRTGGRVGDYEVEVVRAGAPGQVFRTGSRNRLLFAAVAAGLYLLRVRGVNEFGGGPFTNFILIAVGVAAMSGDISAALTWNGPGDVDLHVEEPGGAHVWVGNPAGPTARLEQGDSGALRREIIRVLPGLAAFGVYRFFASCGAGTTALGAYLFVRIAANTAVEAAHLFSSNLCAAGPDPAVGYNLANVAVPSGAVTQTSGTRPAQN